MSHVTQLLSTFVPHHYDLSLDLDRPGRQFQGQVRIEGQALADQHLGLHAKDLTITAITVDDQPATWQVDGDELTITAAAIGTGKDHSVMVQFSGQITDAMHGLYPCYSEHEGTSQELLATQFESHHAREAFPCIDEPAAKATFDLCLTTEANITVLGNMPVTEQRTTGGRLTTRFARTPRMSTYLLAWVCGPLHCRSARTRDGVEVNVWATPAQPARTLSFALDIAVRSIEFYNDYFGVPYPLPKSDHVALPDFSSGAMENWGLITYREVALLADDSTGLSLRHYIATVIAHELAHQWFGNLVTMRWWNDLWLNESFATMMEYVCIDHLHPDWHIWDHFADTETVFALRRDALDGVQSVQVDVAHPDEITTLFDAAIVYAKGARLLAMVRHYLGDTDFQAGLQAYFARHAYGNTVGDDLWQALETASGKPVTRLMNQWISQPGYPVVEARRQGDTISLSQRQFFVGQGQDHGRQWPIPLDAPGLPALLDQPTWQGQAPSADPIRLNRAGHSHFITSYDEVWLAALLGQVSAGTLSQTARMQLLHERSLLVRAGQVAATDLIPLLAHFANETSEPVWNMMRLAIGELGLYVDPDTPAETALKGLAVGLARPLYQRLGWQPQPDEADNTTKLRATIIGLMLYGDDPEARAAARDLYSQHRDELTAIDGELRPLVLDSVVKHGDAALVRELFALYQATASADLEHDLCSALTSTRDQVAIDYLLGQLTDTKAIRPQDLDYWFIYLVRNRHAFPAAWRWLTNHWQWITKQFAGDKSYDSFPRGAAAGPRTPAEAEAYRQFFAPMADDPALARTIRIANTDIAGRVALIEQHGPAVQAALVAHATRQGAV